MANVVITVPAQPIISVDTNNNTVAVTQQTSEVTVSTSGITTIVTREVLEGTGINLVAVGDAKQINVDFGDFTTTNLAEGTNLYYTTARFDARLATKTTADLAEGTNLYWTTARGNANFDARFATRSTDLLAEGSTNKYYTDTKVGTYLSTNGYATETFVNGKISDVISNAPSNLNTLAELASAVNNDANYSATVNTALGTKFNTADFNSTFDTRFATRTTTNLAEGTNLYYTDARARNSLSAGTGVTYNSSTGQISIGQAVGTTSDVAFNSIVINNRVGFRADAITIPTGSNTATVIASTPRNTLKLLLHVVDGVTGALHALEILALRTGSTARMTAYGELLSATVLANFTADISGGNLRIIATPANTNGMTISTMGFGLT